ncbi:hypothetical protein IFM89_036316 [Coptis chinensis]|uniref:Uncharacterized protein n=1 Tax=Coptis chinensis TaxID=261450 RepID=A0A835M365_9MAGN|nr:hypothetical protein IFM89_036316 [Coptis chinensis]
MDTHTQQQPPPNVPKISNHKPKSNPFSFNSITILTTLFAIGVVYIIENFYDIPIPISISSQCKIVSTSVDLRSSKVCELGLLNYKAKNVFYPSESIKFRCRYDYYWASVFKVEYKEYSSGRMRHALAEAPKEALPIDCRPSFDAAWLTKEKFKVNGTYNCRYTPGISQVDIYSDSLFNCHAKDPSIAEMIKRYSILLTRMAYSLLLGEERSTSVVLASLAGVFVGMLTAFMSINLVRLLKIPKPRSVKNSEATRLCSAVHLTRLRRVCFLVAYLSLIGWFTIQYGKVLGLTKIFLNF